VRRLAQQDEAGVADALEERVEVGGLAQRPAALAHGPQECGRHLRLGV